MTPEETKWMIACIFMAVYLFFMVLTLINTIKCHKIQREIFEMCGNKPIKKLKK